MNEYDPIIPFLLDEKVVSPEDLQPLLARHTETGESLLRLLQAGKLVTEEQLAKAVAAVNGFDFVTLSPEMIDPLVAHLISQEMANRHSLIPVRREGGRLVVAMSSPLDLRARDEVELKTGYQIVPVAATAQAVQQAIHFHFDVANVTKQAIASMRLKSQAARSVNEEEDSVLSGGPTLDSGLSDPDAQPGYAAAPRGWGGKEASDDPITKLVASIIRGAIEARASDVHLEPQVSELRVRYRVDGMLRRAVDVPISAQPEVVSHLKILAQMDISEKRIPQDGHISLRHEKRDYDLRVSSLPAVGGEKIVLRILDKNAVRWSLDEGMTSPQDNRKFRELVANPYGMLLLTGPTGSGKTTTLYSVLQLINTPQRNIVTVEDPVEYRLPGITQVQVRPAAGVTFASSLRSILRQDPDIILIGEIRDLETAEIATAAALTGHLVLSTLHTNDAAGAVSRLSNIGIPRFLVASALLGAVAQRLIRTVCPRCRETYEPDRSLVDCPNGTGQRDVVGLRRAEGGLAAPVSSSPQSAIYNLQSARGRGCSSCAGTGYQGRKAVYEILPVSQKIRQMILDGCNDAQLKEQAIQEGMRTLRMNAQEEVLRGVTTIDELMRVVDIKSE
ncbi:MAG: GspE/PulE family protein [Planctomycetes bacterium]|nr:GspE/PulE family protein [Planctomycetota bacterium]